MDVSVILTIGDQSFNVLQCKYGFRRKTNSRGYPLAVAPLRLDINRTIRIDRRWPQTYGFWWEEYKQEEQSVHIAESKSGFTVVDAYWKDKNGREIRDLSVDFPVILYVVLGEFTAGSTVNLTFEDGEGENGIKRADYSAVADSNGIVVIEDFKLELVRKEEGND